MRRFYLVAGLLALLAVAIVGWLRWWPHGELTTAALDEPHGEITTGQKFGVAVGADWRQADAALRSKFKPSYVLWTVGTPEQLARGGGRSGNQPVLTGDSEVSYRDQTWRNGVITLKLSDGRVRKLIWHYAGPFYIDL